MRTTTCQGMRRLVLALLGAVVAAAAVGQAPSFSQEEPLRQQPQQQQQQQAQCLALLSASYPSFSSSLDSSSRTHVETCLRLAHLFAPSSLAPTPQAPLLPLRQSQQEPPQEHSSQEQHLRFPSSFSSPSSLSPPSSPFASISWPHIEATGGDYATFTDPDDIVNLCVAFACVLCAAMAAGLTIGLMVRGMERETKKEVAMVEMTSK